VNAVTSAQREIARWILTQEMDDTAVTETIVDAAERACQKFGRHLARLVAAAGYLALLARALRLARDDFPLLAGVRAGATVDSCFEGLQRSVEGADPALVHDALVTVLAHVFRLLATFIGEDLALRQVRDVWPDAPFRGAELRAEETHP
jgi:NAD(P)-dependent dehydrogenase (short-subunit alcohol dehydrogenase family)